MPPELDRLAENESPREQERQHLRATIRRPFRRRLMPGEKDQDVVEEGPRRHRRLQHRIRAPRLRPISRRAVSTG